MICTLHSAIALLLTVIAPTLAFAQGATLIPFEIEDQHDSLHSDTDLAGKVVILIAGDREGSQFNADWDKAIRKAIETEPRYHAVTFLPVANVHGVPFFVKGAVKKRFPAEKENWVLMDWEGVFAEAYDFEPKSTNVVVFGADGHLAHHAYGREVDHDVLATIVTEVRELLAQ